MIVDRPYQVEAVRSIWTYFQNNSGNPLVAMPTGTGKSVVIARFLQSVFSAYPNQRVMVLTHVKELIQQNYEKLLMVWPFAPAGVYSAGLGKRDTNMPITFAGIASVARNWAAFGRIDLVIIDESHLVSASQNTMYQKFINNLRAQNPYVKVIGLTATPWRLGHGHLTDPVVDPDGNERPGLFTDVCFDITTIEPFNRLIAEGYLCPLVPKPMKTELNVDGVHMRGGEFIEKELQIAVDQEHITRAALEEAVEIGQSRRKWLVFATGIDHSENICYMLNEMGIPAGAVHSQRNDRDKTIGEFRAGKLRALVNANVLTTGFDDPEIDMIVCLRPTASSVLWVQLLGRGTRPLYAPGFDLNDISGRLNAISAAGKVNCLVLDYAGNTKRLGPVNDPVIPRRKGQKGGTAPVKLCDACNSWVHASVRACPTVLDDGTTCNSEFQFQTKLKQEAGSDDLIKGDMPVVKIFKVDFINIDLSKKQGMPDKIKVSYYCGIRKFDEYVCVEHTNYAGKRARQWWGQRTTEPMPATTEEALKVVDQLPAATHLRVWINKKYPEILATCFDGTAFGTEESDGTLPTVHNDAPSSQQDSEGQGGSVAYDDEIPF